MTSILPGSPHPSWRQPALSWSASSLGMPILLPGLTCGVHYRPCASGQPGVNLQTSPVCFTWMPVCPRFTPSLPPNILCDGHVLNSCSAEVGVESFPLKLLLSTCCPSRSASISLGMKCASSYAPAFEAYIREVGDASLIAGGAGTLGVNFQSLASEAPPASGWNWFLGTNHLRRLCAIIHCGASPRV